MLQRYFELFIMIKKSEKPRVTVKVLIGGCENILKI